MRTTLTVHKASTYVRLTGYQPELIPKVLMPFCKRNFVKWAKVPGEVFGTTKWEISHIFAKFNADKTELRFNISKLPDLINFMEGCGYNRSRVQILEEKKISAKKVDLQLLNPSIKPRNEMQEEYCEFMAGPLPLVVNNMTTGAGKAQPLTAKIKIPNGWTTMGQVMIGDTVTAWDGKPTKVTGVFPQGEKQIYRFTFSDGRTTEACKEHLWKVYDCSLQEHKRWAVINTGEILRRFSLPQPRLYIPLPTPEPGEDKKYCLDPWVVGALLGDGSLTGTTTTFTNSIPKEYMSGSEEQRWELLRGLMDTNGTGSGGIPVFNTNSETLASQVQELVWSLGGYAKVTPRIPTYTSKGGRLKGEQSYRVWIRIKDPKRCFSLPRKRDCIPQEPQCPEDPKLRITKVESVGVKEAQCISIDHPDHLYVTDGYVVTHNTFCALYTAVQRGERLLLTILPRYIDIWIKAFGEFYKIKPQDVLIADLSSVQEVHQAVKEKKVDPKIIILPLSKIDIYLKKMKEDPELPGLDQVFEDLQCGTRVIDEAHESIYSVYSSLMYGYHNKTIALSATLSGDDEFINGIYSQIFPHTSYLKPPEYTKYIHVIAYMHRMDLWKYKINTKGFGGYSHVKFEQGILKRPEVFERYYQMLKGAWDTYYIEGYREGQKSMWFFATIEFCEKFNERLLKDYPELDSIVFTSAMSKKNPTAYREHRNVVTTPGSCGTGKDIPQLYIVFSPIAVSSTQRNDQMVGRTRPIDKWWPDLDPIFVYFVCVDEPKQVEYHRKRRGIFDKKMKKYDMIDSFVKI